MNFKNTLYFIIKINLYIKSLIRGGLYRIYVDSPAIEKYQIDRFNIIWKDAYTNVPFYSEWKTKYNLPDCISSLIELNNWPILTKKELQENTNKLLRLNEKPTGYIKTGGSTGEPLHLPTIKDTETAVSMWLGRAAYSIEPGMKTFLIWGHQHLYGKGIKRQINLFIRNIKDWLSNMKRVSAYDLSEGAMRNAFKQYLKFHPEFIIGFSPSILSFVRINVNEKNEQKVYPRAVLCTAGPLTLSEIEEIRLFFNAPVCMEYGSVECGVMAYTEPFNNEYITIWDTHLLQGINDEYGEVKNIVTRLVHCYVPLIRYDIGDYFELDNDGNFNSILRFKSIKGRPSDMVKLKDGTTFFGALIGDCVKQINSIIANQLHVYQNGIRIDIIAIRKLTESDYNLIRSRLNTVIPSLKRQTVIINQVDHISKTIGGKTQLVVLHDSCILE